MTNDHLPPELIPSPQTLKRPITLGITFLGIFILTTIVAYAGYLNYKNSKTPPPTLTLTEPTPVPTPTPDPLAPFNILLMGYGGAGHEGGQLTDTILISHIRPRDKTATLISLPRDTWVNLPLYASESANINYKINAAFALGNDDDGYPNKIEQYSGKKGGINLASTVVETVTNLPIKNTLAVSFYAFTNTINNLGGLNIYVPTTFDDEFYPIKGEEKNTCGKSEEELTAINATMSGELLEREFKCRYENLHFDAGTTYMDGETALKFVRSRHSKQYGGDFSRSQRQQALVKALKTKIISLNFIPKIPGVIKNFKNSVYTDISTQDIANYLSIMGDLKEYKIKTINLDTTNVFQYGMSSSGQSILIPKEGINDFTGIQTYLQQELTPQPASPSAEASKSGQLIQ